MCETEANMSLAPYVPSTSSRSQSQSQSQSPSFCSQSQLYQSTPELSNRYSPNLVKRMENSTCYTCGQIGHWSWDCPHKNSNNNTKSFNNNSHSTTDRVDKEKMCETEVNMSLRPYAPSTPSRTESQSPSFCSQSQLYPNTPELSNRYSPNLVKRMENSTCYTCGQIGHWSWDCPHKISNSNSKPFNNDSHSETDRVDEEKMCETEANMSPPPYAPSTPSRSESQSRSPSFCSESLQYPSTPELSNHYSPNLVKRMENSTCYTCGQIGHWSWDCSHKISNNNTKPFNNDSHSATDRIDEEKMCETEANMSPPPYAPSTPSRSESQSQSPSFCSESQQYPSTPELSNRYSPNLVKRMENSTCYTCGQIGHWSCDCPPRNSNNNTKPFNNDSHSAKKLWHCRCGHGFWEEKTAKNDRNYGKMYYACPIKRGAKCNKGFIQWCEDPIDDSYLQPPPFKYPECECGAGVCRRVEGTLNHTVKYYFTCPIKQNHGSCGYVVREDELLDNIRTVPQSCKRSLSVCLESEQNDQSQTDDEFGEGGRLLMTHWKRTRIMDSSEIRTLISVSQANLSQRKDAVLQEDRWGDSGEIQCSLLRPSRISQENLFQRHIFYGGAAAGFCPMGWLGRLLYFCPAQSMKFPSSQPIFCCIFPSFNPIVVPEQESIPDDPCGFSCLSQQQTQLSTPCGFSSLSQQTQLSTICGFINLSQQTQLSTICGFINLSQQTQLSTPSHPELSSDDVSPKMSQNVPASIPDDPCGFSSLSQQTQLSTICAFINLSQQTELSTPYHTELSSGDVSRKMSQRSERKLLSKAQRQRQMAFVAQQQLLKDLIALEPDEHESMREAAEDTFAMLDRLGATEKQFCELIWNFINLTSSVAQMTQSIENSLTLEEHNKCVEEEKARLDHIQNEYVKTEALLKVSDERRQSLCKDISDLETMLHEKQNQLKFCELETLNIEIELGDLKCNMIEAESALKSRTEQAKVAEELREEIQETQVMQIVAKTALKKATVGLEYFNNLSIV